MLVSNGAIAEVISATGSPEVRVERAGNLRVEGGGSRFRVAGAGTLHMVVRGNVEVLSGATIIVYGDAEILDTDVTATVDGTNSEWLMQYFDVNGLLRIQNGGRVVSTTGRCAGTCIASRIVRRHGIRRTVRRDHWQRQHPREHVERGYHCSWNVDWGPAF
jgi:hypothetical protein